MDLALVGLNHKTAPVAVREKVAFNKEEAQRALAALTAMDCMLEALVLSTCNRTEIYGVFKKGCLEPDVLSGFMAEFNDLECNKVEPCLYTLTNTDVVQHLFRVVSGLDSMVVGENQIAAQVKEAYRLATTVHANGPIVDKLFHMAFRTSKRVRTQTGIGAGSLSVSQVAVDLAQKIFRDLSKQNVLLIGAGENGELTAKILREHGLTKLYIANRTREKAKILADSLRAEVLDFDDLGTSLSKVDIVITSTGSVDPVVRPDHVSHALSRRHRPLFLIDMAIPRDVDPAVDELDNVFLYDMDALQKIVEESKGRRSEEAHKAKRIVGEEVDKFMTWRKAQKATPTIVEIQSHFEHIRQAELEKLRSKLSEEDLQQVDAATRAMMNKMLHNPIVSLRDAAKREDAGKLIPTIRKVLGLGEES